MERFYGSDQNKVFTVESSEQKMDKTFRKYLLLSLKKEKKKPVPLEGDITRELITKLLKLVGM